MKRLVTLDPSDSGDVFRDLGFSGQAAENLRVRSFLMLEVERIIGERDLTQVQAAELFGVTQPRISDLIRGKIDHFTIDSLLNMLAEAGVRVEVKVG